MGKIKLSNLSKKRKSLIVGIFGLLIGGYMIFIWKDNLGFIPAIIGAFLLVWKR